MTKRIGNQEPTQSLILPYDETHSDEAIELYEKSGREVYEWQKNLLNAILAVDSNLWTHMTFGYSVPRQNGKNEVVAIREIFGLYKGERGLHTAHRTSTSGKAFERVVAILEESGLEKDEDFKQIKAIGRERIELTETGGIIEFRTRTTTGGLGESFDYLVIDEAQEYTDDERSALMYTISASANPQTIMLGTPPTPISSGTVFVKYRESCLSGGNEDAGWAEWSVEEESDVRDVDLWYQTNPSLGIRIAERTIRQEVGNDDLDFNVQRLGLWIRYNQKSVISQSEWEDLKVKTLPKFKGKLFAGIKYGHDGTNVAMSIAVKTNTGDMFVETIDCQSVRSGNAWIIAFLKQADIQEVVIDGASGQTILADEMKDSGVKVKPILPTVKEIIVANSTFEQGLFQQTLKHNGQPSLSQVVTNCDKRNIGTSGGFGYRSQIEENDIALMDSVILAHWAAATAKPKQKQKISY